ncbi:flagellar basal body P-ring formation chaperone FlgA [Oceanisphaera avium]|uniref:Flagella basal body P-ring formation protein FlgA n=1 Tax=Oceanisphaera avium TaxID=1903694 RepID=A0A1Y0CXX8_9GAMM|nr:flagellar basal body P-ring formation chaperone FlgA [Oceanisphaera avium]ART79757.1 flagella basal body P-ring formation protein FlgA [Oceanisphaera avium]
MLKRILLILTAAFSRISTLLGLGALFLLLLTATTAQAQSLGGSSVHDEIRRYAEQYVKDLVPLQPEDKLLVQAASIDTRLALTECLGQLTADIRGSGDVKRNTHVYLKCHENPGWEIFVPVRVKILKPVVTAADPITRNTLLQAQHLSVDYQDEVLLRGDIFSDPSELIGSRSKRDLRAGQPILSSQLCVVCKGDRVSILAQTGGLTIKTDGIAKEDGTFNDSIRVSNVNSGREISARIISAGQVQVRL